MCSAEEDCGCIDKIVTVCAALCNYCESIVPREQYLQQNKIIF